MNGITEKLFLACLLVLMASISTIFALAAVYVSIEMIVAIRQTILGY